MHHLSEKQRKTPRKAGTSEAWLPVAAQISHMANSLAKRDDLAATAGPGLGGPYGTACFTPATAEIEVNTDTLLPMVAPHTVDLTSNVWKMGRPLFVGAIAHEAAHARYTKKTGFDYKKHAAEPGGEPFKPEHIEILQVLEESSIEAQVLRDDKSLRIYLRSIVFELLMSEMSIPNSSYGASITAALVLARHDAGVLTTEETEPFRKLVLTRLDEEALAGFRALWTKYHRVHSYDSTRYPWTEDYQIAERWLKLVEDSKKPDEESNDESLEELFKMAAGIAAGAVAVEAAEKHTEMRDSQTVKEREEAAAHRAKSAAAAREVFSESPGVGTDGDEAGDKSLAEVRNPMPEERVAATQLAKALDRLTYTDRTVKPVRSVLPGGKLNARGALERSAQIDTGRMATAAPWVQKKRIHNDDPMLRVGLMTDVSGSMSAATAPMASSSWVLANAIEKMHGLFASVTFGAECKELVRPHSRQQDVRTFSAMDLSEVFKDAALALDGALNLLDGDGAKVLVIASDGIFVREVHRKYARSFLQMCKKNSVSVVWLDFTGMLTENMTEESRNKAERARTPWYGQGTHGYGKVVNVQGASPSEVAAKLGEAILDQVRKVKH